MITQENLEAIKLGLDRLHGMSLAELRSEWRKLYRAGAPRISRDLLVLGLAFRLQADFYGDLGKATTRKLRSIARSFHGSGRVVTTPSLSLKPGARLVREWRNRTIVVTVTEDGFEYDGASFGSLSTIAKEITGAHWSGPRFFGLTGKTAEVSGHMDADG